MPPTNSTRKSTIANGPACSVGGSGVELWAKAAHDHSNASKAEISRVTSSPPYALSGFPVYAANLSPGCPPHSGERAPGPPVARHQLFAGGGPVAPCGILRNSLRRMRRPGVEDRLPRLPARLDVVRAL